MHKLVITAQQVKCETGKPVRLIILDTLARCFGGADENDSKDMGVNVKNFSRWLTKLEQDGLITRNGQKLTIVNRNNEN
ncbi:AAA family ATPase [Xenorhabdus siamensis]|uniref:AAA family ATPase n=1 Tax=Xenorhabdus siamensis TaxID=3136254 RepID=UPI003BF49C9D